jgi:DNA invertase Pin-like site-specific DNA recombinase
VSEERPSGLTAIAYQRWSTPEQGSGDSKRRQDDLVNAYCKEKGITLLDTQVDPGVSAFRGANAATGKLRLLMAEIASGRLKTDYILFETFDRMSRDTALDAIELLQSIIKLGPTVVTLTDQHEYSRQSIRDNPMQLIWATVQMMRGHDETLRKSRLSKSAWVAKRERASTTPMTAKCPPWIVPVKEKVHTAKGDKFIVKEFNVNADKAQVVRDIYQMAANGDSLVAIAKHLNGMKILPLASGREANDRSDMPIGMASRPLKRSRAKFWYRQQVLRILKSKAVIGTHEPMLVTYERDKHDNLKKVIGPLEEIPNYYPLIVDEALANKVWQLNKTRSKFKSAGNVFITGGLARCFRCSGMMTYNGKPKY